MAYMGSTDPDGWIICNGVSRTNNSDSRYNSLNTLSIGTGGSGTANYTPPDYRGRFLQSSATVATGGTVGGASTVTLNSNHLPEHNHTITSNVTDTMHSHPLASANMNVGGLSNTDNDTSQVWGEWGNRLNVVPAGGRTGGGSHLHGIEYAYSNISVSSTCANAGSATTSSINIIPPFISVNWIMKY